MLGVWYIFELKDGHAVGTSRHQGLYGNIVFTTTYESEIVEIRVTFLSFYELAFPQLTAALGDPTDIWLRIDIAPDGTPYRVDLISFWMERGVFAEYYFDVGTVTDEEVSVCFDGTSAWNLYLWSADDIAGVTILDWMNRNQYQYQRFEENLDLSISEFIHNITHGVECVRFNR
jgi:hypothetical protein